MSVNDRNKIFFYILHLVIFCCGIGYTQEKQKVESLPILKEYHSELFELKYLLSIPKNNRASDFHCFTFSSDGRYVVCGNSDNGLLLINLDNLNSKIHELDQETIQAVEFFP